MRRAYNIMRTLLLLIILLNSTIALSPVQTYMERESVESEISFTSDIIELKTSDYYGKAMRPRYQSLNIDLKNRIEESFRRHDRDDDGISDVLEEALIDNNFKVRNILYDNTSGGRIGIIISFSANPARNANETKILEMKLRELIGYLEGELNSRGVTVELRYGPYTYVTPGFSLWVPSNISILESIVNIVSGIDLDNDGSSDRVLIQPVTLVKVQNYMTTRQTYIRPYVWVNLGINGSGITVAVSDTGVDDFHPGFTGKIVHWIDYVNSQSSPYDDHSHGTHVSGTILGSYTTEATAGSNRHGLYIPSASSGYYFGWYVWSTGGTIRVYASGLLASANLYYSGDDPLWLAQKKGTLQQVASGNPIEYTVSQPGWYFAESTSRFGGSMEFEVPIEDVDYGYDFMCGMAPNANLASYKVCDNQGSCASDAILNSMNDAIANRETYGIKIHNFSLGGSYAGTYDSIIDEAATSGLLFVVAAGNDGSGSNYAGNNEPAAVPKALTVAATDHFPFNITSYSSQGGPSTVNSSIIKPDVAFVGGGAYWVSGTNAGVYSAITSDVYSSYPGWSLEMRGTSMSTPGMSGVAALVAQAVTQSIGWNYTSQASQSALMVKNIILINTYELYPLTRISDASNSPTLEKGGKDPHEGWGFADPYAAIVAALSMSDPLVPGSIIDGWFRRGAIYQGAVTNEFGPSVWSKLFMLPNSTITLPNGSSFSVKYKFKLYITNGNVADTDYDLYIYRYNPDPYSGDPVILVKSVQDFGYNESITYTPSSDGEYVWVVAKRAREDSAGGNWTLVTGPTVFQYGTPEGGVEATEPGQAWIGWPIKVNGTASKDVSRVVIEVWASNGTLLARLDSANGDVTIVDPSYYNYYEATYTLPYDTNLVGQTLTIVTYLYDSTGTLTEGPVAQSGITVNSATAPIPEPTITPIIIVGIVVIIYVLLNRRK